MVSLSPGDSAEQPGQSVSYGAAELILPAFMKAGADGVMVDTRSLPSAEEFERIVERIFSSGYYFMGLNYGLFQRLLYDFDPARDAGTFRLASEIRSFPPARRGLYRNVRVANGKAEYLFEPVTLESTVDEPVCVTDDKGETQVVGSERKVVTEKASLDVDEFIADMWAKGIRFGIDVAKIRSVIEEGRFERVIVASDKAPLPGCDAGVKEQTKGLHRDNTPRITPDGRIDLTQFQNRFPQIKKGAALLMKVPRVLGTPGRSVAGRALEAPLPQDFNLASLAGEGTRVEVEDDHEYIVAVMDGFLNVDNATNCISITEKIINRDGVSARTTGNLALAGDEYEEFGEVQEGRVVEGKSLTFHANVFGKVVSAGGDIVLEQNLVGGTALNANGSITVNGLASNAVLHTAQGLINVKRAENCLLIGDRVQADWAANCTILAEEVEIEMALGCAIAGKRIHAGAVAARSGQEALISLLLPDVTGMDQAQEKERGYIRECEELTAKLKDGIEHLMNDPEVRKYFTIAGKIHRKEIVLSHEQQGPWQQMGARLAPTLKRINQARNDVKALEEEIKAVQSRIEALEAKKKTASEGLECRLDSVQGDTVVRSLVLPQDAPPLQRLPPRELKQRLSSPDPTSKRLFSGATGQFDWKPE